MTRFGTIMNEELRSKCLASCIKIKHCISYMQGLPNPNKLRPNDKKMHLLLMATDVPVQTGLDELLYLGEKIRKLLKSAIQNMNNFEDLMRNVELYCCLATFRELFLIYRFSFQSMLEVNAESVRNVIDAQQENDQSVLEFLYKPTVENVKLFYEVLQGDWPLSRAFCERRGLLVEDLVVLDKGVYIIESVADKSKLYTISDSYLRSGKVIDCVFMESSRRKGRNVFSFQTESNFVGASESARHLCLTDTKEFWNVLKVRGNTSIGKECYMIWLKSDIKKCLCQERKDSRFLALPFGQQTTCLSTPKDINSSFLWTIESL
ncbi:uncharacterized protein LOC132736094 [Ruditapes philippinarum]|uniref:uncharacterized protein LOC132736094 n=1 Tax=Ruditapes philippinarum TaxID=129788 RepID=UPI00295B0EA5|nr:uncharacterized protein LOC132736094 [Ruditapes philippinarum]